MERIKRNERMAALTKLLTASPNRIFTLSYFCEMFGAAKSTLSEDIDLLRGVFDAFGLGRLDTVTGAAGGVRYRPVMKPGRARVPQRAVRRAVHALAPAARRLSLSGRHFEHAGNRAQDGRNHRGRIL